MEASSWVTELREPMLETLADHDPCVFAFRTEDKNFGQLFAYRDGEDVETVLTTTADILVDKRC